MRKLIVLALVCLGLMGVVGCSSKDYGIFDKEYYKNLSEDSIESITDYYNAISGRIAYIRDEEYEKTITVKIPQAEDLKIDSLELQSKMANIISSIYSRDLNNIEAFQMYYDTIEDLENYLNEDAIDRVTLTKDQFDGMKNYINSIPQL